MVITVNIYYQSINGNAKKFAEEMISSGIVNEIRSENGNIRYDYFFPMDDNETVLLIDSWNDQHALDIHHASSMMKSPHPALGDTLKHSEPHLPVSKSHPPHSHHQENETGNVELLRDCHLSSHLDQQQDSKTG